MDCKIIFPGNSKNFFEPGQKLKCDVVLKLKNNEKINKIVCQITGIAKCRWNVDSPDGTSYNSSNKGRQVFINQEFLLFGDLSEPCEEFSTGCHNFKVNYVLSSNLPTSFKCKNGSIKYNIRIIVERPWKISSHYDFPFTVVRPLNLNRERFDLGQPLFRELTKDFKLDFTPEPLHLSASIPSSGFVPGQTVDIQIQVNNNSKTHIKDLKVSLKKIVLLTSQNPRRRKNFVIPEAKISLGSVPIQTTKHFEEKITIPSLSPNIENCEIIKVTYELRVKALTSGINRSPKLVFPITIGTVPLEGRDDGTFPDYDDKPPPSYEEVMRELIGGGNFDDEINFTPGLSQSESVENISGRIH